MKKKVYVLSYFNHLFNEYSIEDVYTNIPTRIQLLDADIPFEYHSRLLELNREVNIEEFDRIYRLEERVLK